MRLFSESFLKTFPFIICKKNNLLPNTRAQKIIKNQSQKIGADFLLLIFPERYYGEDNTYTFFKTVANASDISILIHEMPMRNGLGGGTVQYSLPLLERLLEIKNIAGFKEESLDMEYSNTIVEKFSSKAEMIGAGGGMSRYFLRDHKRGSKTFLGGIGNFIPELELNFFELMSHGKIEEAGKIVNEIEIPYFNDVVPMGWHPSLKAALHLKNLLPEYERPPMKQVAGAELKKLQEVLRKNDWL